MAAPNDPVEPRAPSREESVRRGPRPRGTVRTALVDAGMQLARGGGPDAVVLREATRMVGVAPNAAYRHFSNREALLGAVRDTALGQLAQSMADGMSRVQAPADTPAGAMARLAAVGRAYLEFARSEPGLFDTAFATAEPHHVPSTEPRPFDYLQGALDNLVQAGVLDAARRPNIEYPTWATVHGLAVLFRGPLQSLSEPEKDRLEGHALGFIGAAITARDSPVQ